MASDHFSLSRALDCLKEIGWTPGAVIDVGVAAGTPGLYSVWPGVPICLIEPAPDAMVYMRQIAEKYPNVQIFNCGASDHAGELTARQPAGMARVFFGRGKGLAENTLPVRTCDDMVAEARLEGPFLLKIDTDCHERQVLDGAEETLKRTEVCVIELNVFHPLRGEMGPLEICRHMAKRGFVFFDMAGFSLAQSGLMRAADFVFVRYHAPLFRAAYERSGKADKLAKRARQYREFAEHNPII
jgi:FkbM family methyltransferase